ncbi:unnamed protein product [Brachionus calyciflorus]|uniref:PAN-3 domain-containing protein n=1 Tax=Brachionus calyciflorus TaxID=104777 RepID=A0A814LF34_9BILA|nr:unnamed protein product [Brachionus calyciflorus]
MDVSYDTFLVMNYIILNNESLTVKIKAVNKFSCLQKCSLEPNCMYAFYERYECVLYAFSDTYNMTSSNNSQIYAKKFRKTEEQNEIILENVDSKVCNMSSEFWSLKKNSCEPCKPEFVKFSEVPFLCYHHTGGFKTFAQSKSYCETKTGVLFLPKTKQERDFFPKKFPGKKAYVNSMITKLGEKFKWPDGTNVFGFDWFQPDNLRWPWFLIENSLIINSNGYFHDFPDNRTFDLTICQHD